MKYKHPFNNKKRSSYRSDIEYLEDQFSMTHHDFRGVPGKCRMDWVLVSGEFKVKDARIIRDHFGGRYPSDHFPYAVEVDWA